MGNPVWVKTYTMRILKIKCLSKRFMSQVIKPQLIGCIITLMPLYEGPSLRITVARLLELMFLFMLYSLVNALFTLVGDLLE